MKESSCAAAIKFSLKGENLIEFILVSVGFKLSTSLMGVVKFELVSLVNKSFIGNRLIYPLRFEAAKIILELLN